MDIKEKIEGLVEHITSDKDLMDQFQQDPVKAVEKLIGVELPDDVIEQIVTGVKGKLSVDRVMDAVDTFKKLF